MYQAAAFCFKYTSVSPIKSISYISIYWIWFILEETSRKKILSKRSYSITILSTTFIQEYIISLEKAMATHSSVLAWRIPGTGEPGGLPSLGSHRVGHDWCDLAAAAVYYFLGCQTWSPNAFNEQTVGVFYILVWVILLIQSRWGYRERDNLNLFTKRKQILKTTMSYITLSIFSVSPVPFQNILLQIIVTVTYDIFFKSWERWAVIFYFKSSWLIFCTNYTYLK